MGEERLAEHRSSVRTCALRLLRRGGEGTVVS